MCVGKVNEVLGFAMLAQYVDDYFDEDIRTEIQTMIEHWKTAFKSLVDEASWVMRITIFNRFIYLVYIYDYA